MCACEAERPRGDALVGAAGLQLFGNVRVHVGQTSAKQRFHDDGGDVALGQLVVEVFRIHVAAVLLLRVAPIHVVELNLREVPCVAALVVELKQQVEDFYVTVERETEVAYASALALFNEVVKHAVVQEPTLKLLHAAHAYAVEQHEVNVVHHQFLERVFVHLHGCLARPLFAAQIAYFGGDEPLVPRMAVEGDARYALTLAVAIGGCRVKVVYAVRNGMVHQPVHSLLVNLSVLVRHGEPSQAAVAKEAHLVTRCGYRAESH